MCIRDRDICVHLGLLEFSLQMLVADIVNEIILGTDIMDSYGFFVDLRGNILRFGQEKIKFSATEVINQLFDQASDDGRKRDQEVQRRGTQTLVLMQKRNCKLSTNLYDHRRGDWKTNCAHQGLSLIHI